MSSKPSPGGVEKTIALIDRLGDLQREAAELRPKVKRLAEVDAAIMTTSRELDELYKSMDVELPTNGPSNYGNEGRFTWFIAELMRQVRRNHGG